MLVKPVISEKSLAQATKGWYTFEVMNYANKTDIKTAVEKIYQVSVKKIHTITIPGKKYRSGKKWMFSIRPNTKKAVVSLSNGQKIDLFETGENKEEKNGS